MNEPLMQSVSRLMEFDPMAEYRRRQELREKQQALCEKNIIAAALDLIYDATNAARYPSCARDELVRIKARVQSIEAALDILDPVEPLPEDDEQLNAHARADEREQAELRRG